MKGISEISGEDQFGFTLQEAHLCGEALFDVFLAKGVDSLNNCCFLLPSNECHL